FTLDMKGEKPILMVSASSTQGMVDPQLIVEGPEAYYFNPFEREISDDMKFATFTTTAELMYEPDELMSRNNLRLTLVDGVEAVEVGAADMPNATGEVLATQVAAEPIGLSVLLSMLFAALLGGLILNLMPCVLPVLSIKLMSVIDKSGQSNAKVRLGFLATTAGIITSFLALAAALIVLKSVGASIGWGVQFQQPLFVLALLAIILLFAANMFGWFEIGLPHSVSGLGAGGQNKGLLSDFATGAFATLLATPCSAPFLGTAVSFALAQNAATILLIFAALGVGMALPYILVMVFPRLISYLPRPGLWMVKLRVVLGGLLVLTAIWLTSILLTQLGLVSTVVTVLLSIVLLAAVWVFRASGKKLIATAVLTSVALLLVPPMFKADFSQNTSKLEAPWVVFDQQAIATHIAEGKVVYVDVTADWCVTCKVNKAIVFASDDVNAAFASTHLVAMVADWTRPSTEINAYLQSFNRAGIPFNAVYSAKHPNGKALPEILTPKLVLEELANAK
ncbi:MAG: protein-disulfide reductase DsbD family protein, partial [Alphaproteobacteria bacterium]